MGPAASLPSLLLLGLAARIQPLMTLEPFAVLCKVLIENLSLIALDRFKSMHAASIWWWPNSSVVLGAREFYFCSVETYASNHWRWITFQTQSLLEVEEVLGH
jgi:hypothetical protein